MSDSKCVITGCWLRMVPSGMAVWGDLHTTQSAWVFVACTNNTGGIAWQFGADLGGERRITLIDDRPCFESRGVFVFSHDRGELSEAADAYIKSGERLRFA